MNSQTSLPDFEHPPAVETLLAFAFRPLEKWQTQYFGLFWQEIKAEYPNVQVHPPLNSDQGLKVEVTPDKARIRVTGEVDVRWWYFHKSGKRLIQVQNNSFVQNWRKRSRHDPYLHYAELRPAFIRSWNKFRSFLKAHRVEEPVIETCEVTYVNHIDKGAGWDSISDLGNIVTCWSQSTSLGFLPRPNVVNMNIVYPFGERSGQLQLGLSRGIREADKEETLQLVLTARCRPETSDADELLTCLDLNRRWVVNGFADITTPAMHQIWGKKERVRRRTK